MFIFHYPVNLRLVGQSKPRIYTSLPTGILFIIMYYAVNLCATLTADEFDIMSFLTSILINNLITPWIIQLVYSFSTDSAFIPNFLSNFSHNHGLDLVIEKDWFKDPSIR